MVNKDEIIIEIDRLVENLLGFERDCYYQINGTTTYANLTQTSLDNNIFSFNLRKGSLLHFTNLKSAAKILESKFLKMSNLAQFEDRTELIHSLGLMGLDRYDLNESKKYIFATCFTPKYKGVINGQYEYHWENYGDGGKGCAFEFLPIRTPLYPFHFSLNMNYIDDITRITLLEKIKGEEFDDVILNALIPIFSSIKQKQYEKEEEVRILYQNDKENCDNYLFSDKRLCFDIKSGYTSRLPFVFSESNQCDPMFLLKKVYIKENDVRSADLRCLISSLDDVAVDYVFLEKKT